MYYVTMNFFSTEFDATRHTVSVGRKRQNDDAKSGMYYKWVLMYNYYVCMYMFV